MKVKLGLGVALVVLPLLIGLILLIGVIALMAGVFINKIPPGETPVRLRPLEPGEPTDQVHEVTKEYFDEAIGGLKAASRTEISARVLAPITRIAARAGQMVQAGEVLVELDARAFVAQRNQAQSNLAAAQAAARQAENVYRQNAPLREKGIVSQADFDAIVRDMDVTRANLERAGEAVSEADIMLSYTKIKAPKPGIVVDRLAEEGDMARPGVALLTLYDPTSLRLEVPVMENLAGKLKVGQRLAVHIDALDQDVPGTVDEIVPQAEAGSRSFLVKLRVPNTEGTYEGMAGRVRIPVGTRRHLCLVTAAIQRIGQLEFVDVVTPDGKYKQRRYIRTGRLGMPGRIEVLSGLEAGERVVLHAGKSTAP